MVSIAIDDEPLALQLIREYAEKISFLDLQKTFTNPEEAAAWLAVNDVDLLFLDIQMPKLNGFQMLKKLMLKKP